MASVPRARWPGRHRKVVTALVACFLGLVSASSGPAAGAEPLDSPDVMVTTGAVAAHEAVAAPPTLRQGSRGLAVVALQRRLHGLGYDAGPFDGEFGSQTFHGVVAFQKVNNLPRDGIVGPGTWARLAQPLVPRARYAPPGYSVEVRLDKQVLFLVRDGAVVRILDSSTGKASTPTPAGDFTVVRRIDGWRQSRLGLMWRPNYFSGGYAIHGYSSVPTYPASHGCVRITIPAMDRLWPRLGIGVPVHVYYRR
jgi:N-acetylmuramoyl-L-alanine amidase